MATPRRARFARRFDAREVSFLIADFSGRSLVRLGHSASADADRREGSETAERLPLDGTAYGKAIREQSVEVTEADAGARVLAPVTNRGEAIGLLEVHVRGLPGERLLADVAVAAHALAYLVIANRRYTDLFDWGQRSVPLSLSAEIQHQLLPDSYSLEAGVFTLASWLEPAGEVGGDTFDFSLDRDTPHLSMSDAMGHAVGSALQCVYRVQELALEPGDRLVFLTDGMTKRDADQVDIPAAIAATRELHPREMVQELCRIVLEASGGDLRDDATVLCLDWHGGSRR